MFKIVEKKSLNPTVSKITVEAPLIAKKAEPGQFIIFRAKEDSERIPLTIADFDREAGTVTIIYQIVGAGTMELDTLNEGDYIHDFVGPLGVPTHTEGLKKVAVVGGGVGCAIAYPITKKLHQMGAEVHAIVGFRNQNLVILEDEFLKEWCSEHFLELAGSKKSVVEIMCTTSRQFIDLTQALSSHKRHIYSHIQCHQMTMCARCRDVL